MKKVFVVGDSMLDVYETVDVVGMSPEAPVPVVRPISSTYMYGGAANAAANCAALGAHTTLLARIGDDIAGSQFKSIKPADNLTIQWLPSFSSTIVKKRLVNTRDEHLLRIDYEPILNPVTSFDLNINDYDVLFVSDYGRESLSCDILKKLIQSAVSSGVFVIVNGKPKNIQVYQSAHVIQFNWKEATEASCGKDMSSLLTYAQNVLVTNGENGMLWWRSINEKPIHIPPVPVKVADVIGAGDTVAATIAADGKISIETLGKAAMNASVVVSKHRTVTP